MPKMLNKIPIGIRISIPIRHLREDDVQNYSGSQHDGRESQWTLVPAQLLFLGSLRKRVNQANQIFFGMRLGRKTYCDGDEEACGPRKDCSPEVLRHFTRIRM